MSIDLETLKRAIPYAGLHARVYLEPLNAAMEEFDINNRKRQAAFLAQVAHESGDLAYVLEIASGEAYEGRQDLGNTERGDGVRFKGRGLIQITGRANYRECGQALGFDLELEPEILEQPFPAARSAAWFWWKHGLNELADRDQFQAITRRINGGLTGIDRRIAAWVRAQNALA